MEISRRFREAMRKIFLKVHNGRPEHIEEQEQLANQHDIIAITQTMESLEISEKFWSNEVIWNEITSHLNISDLKELSCVNHYFLHSVRSINRFTCIAGQVVKGKLEIHVFKLCRAIVLVNEIDDEALEERAPEIFQDTEYLEIHCLREDEDDEELSHTKKNSRLIQIIGNCPKLKSFSFRTVNFPEKENDYFWTHSSVKPILSKLKKLHLEVYTDKHFYRWNDSLMELASRSNPFQSFKLLSELPMSLVKFSYKHRKDRFTTCFFSPELVLSSSQNTLVELELHLPFGSTLGIQNMIFPKLKKFILMFHIASSYTEETFNQQTFDMNFVKFFKNHLLSLTHVELDSSEMETSFTAVCETLQFSKIIRVLLLGRANGWYYEKKTTSLIGEEWDSLANIPNLCSLEVWSERSHNDSVPDLHDHLGNFNRYVEMLSSNANSFKFWSPWWKDFDNRDYFTATVKSTFMKFQNLAELKLFAFLTDEILQFVCKHLNKLLVFEGDFSEVSDFGISGIREHDNYNSGISIVNLKGLRRLCMCHMSLNITWNGLLQSIYFLELVDLRVDGDAGGKAWGFGELGYPKPQTSLKKVAKKGKKSIWFPGKKWLFPPADKELKNNSSLPNVDVDQDNKRNYLRLINKNRNPSLEKVCWAYYNPKKSERENIQRVNPRTKFYNDNPDCFGNWRLQYYI